MLTKLHRQSRKQYLLHKNLKTHVQNSWKHRGREGSRSLDRLLHFFGLASIEKIPSDKPVSRDYPIKKLPLLNEVVTFSVWVLSIKEVEWLVYQVVQVIYRSGYLCSVKKVCDRIYRKLTFKDNHFIDATMIIFRIFYKLLKGTSMDIAAIKALDFFQLNTIKIYRCQ